MNLPTIDLPTINLSRIACKYADIALYATLPDGAPATIFGVDIAVVRAGDSPDETTSWLSAQYANGVATVMLAGSDFTNPPPTAVVVSEPGGDLWARIVDVPETDAALICRIVLV